MSNKSKREQLSERGFTLVEIIVVIVILGILMTTFGGKVFTSAERARADLTKTKMEEIKHYIGEFNLRYNKNPRNFQDLTQCTDLTGSGCTPIISDEKDLKDAWGNDLVFQSSGGRTYSITSYGADGQAGGEGVDSDIKIDGP
ncbi:MAG: type II secretion system protein GspG [Bdellovibrionota bacterium]|jgi:general secretion pathway protein G